MSRRPCTLPLLLALLSLSHAPLGRAQPDHAFLYVPVDQATALERESALFLRSAWLSDARESPGLPHRRGGFLVSLNPADPQLPPVIFDTAAESLTPVGGAGETRDGILIVRPLELGAFAGKFAAAKALVREQGKEREAWGYVDRNGRWIVAPRHDRAKTPVNRWATVSQGNDWNSRDTQILDLEAGKPLALPAGRAPRHVPREPLLQALGPHAYFDMNLEADDDHAGATPFLLDGTSGRLVELPSRPALSQTAGGKAIVLEDGSLFAPATGKRLPLPGSAAVAAEPMVNVFALVRPGGQAKILDIWDAEAQTIIARNLGAVKTLTPDIFVACNPGNDGLFPLVLVAQEAALPPTSGSKLQCGLMDRQGRWRTGAEFQHFHLLDRGRVVLRAPNKWCELDLRSEAPPDCRQDVPAALLSTGLWLDVVETRDGSWPVRGPYGYRDAQGQVRIPFRFDLAQPFTGRIAAVEQWGVPGIIDAGGTWLTPPPPRHALALTLESNARTRRTPCDPCYGLIDRAGSWLWPPVLAEAQASPNPGEFWIRGNGDSNFLLADSSGEIRQHSRYQPEPGKTQPPEGMQLLPDKMVATSVNGKWGLADSGGNWLVPPRFDELEVMSDSRALARTGDGWGMIDAHGTWLVPPQYAYFSVLNDELASACDDNYRHCQTYTSQGRPAPDSPRIAAAGAFDARGMAPAQAADSNLWGYVDRQGRWVIPPAFAAAAPFTGDFALVAGAEAADSPPLPASAYLVDKVSSWPTARLTAVSVLPPAALEAARQGKWSGSDYSWPAAVGLVDGEGRWLIPKASYWQTLR